MESSQISDRNCTNSNAKPSQISDDNGTNSNTKPSQILDDNGTNSNAKPLLIFDHDGTLHDTMHIYEPAMRHGIETVKALGYGDISVTSKEISSWLGLKKQETWDRFAPQLPPEVKDKMAYQVGSEMVEMALLGKGKWFDGAAETMERLKNDGYHMVILSNCDKRIAATYWKAYGIGRWFDRIYDSESYGNIAKEKIAVEVMKDYPGNAIVIGDRAADMLCARAINMPFIGCAYGYGSKDELNDADAIAQDVTNIYELVHRF